MEPEEGFITGRVLRGGECSLCVSLPCGPRSAGHGPTRSSVRSDPGFSCYDPDDDSSFLFYFLAGPSRNLSPFPGPSTMAAAAAAHFRRFPEPPRARIRFSTTNPVRHLLLLTQLVLRPAPAPAPIRRRSRLESAPTSHARLRRRSSRSSLSRHRVPAVSLHPFSSIRSDDIGS
jgi:hypothetical protein